MTNTIILDNSIKEPNSAFFSFGLYSDKFAQFLTELQQRCLNSYVKVSATQHSGGYLKKWLGNNFYYFMVEQPYLNYEPIPDKDNKSNGISRIFKNQEGEVCILNISPKLKINGFGSDNKNVKDLFAYAILDLIRLQSTIDAYEDILNAFPRTSEDKEGYDATNDLGIHEFIGLKYQFTVKNNVRKSKDYLTRRLTSDDVYVSILSSKQNGLDELLEEKDPRHPLNLIFAKKSEEYMKEKCEAKLKGMSFTCSDAHLFYRLLKGEPIEKLSKFWSKEKIDEFMGTKNDPLTSECLASAADEVKKKYDFLKAAFEDEVCKLEDEIFDKMKVLQEKFHKKYEKLYVSYNNIAKEISANVFSPFKEKLGKIIVEPNFSIPNTLELKVGIDYIDYKTK